MVDDKKVLLTGGAGSVGHHLLRLLLDNDPAVVRVLDNSEAGLANLKRSIESERVRYLHGDIRDKDRLERAMSNIDYVIHAAAMKHVDIAEYNPFEAVKTNVVGLQNSIDAAIEANVSKFVFTSSDKAVHPANAMGTTKLLGERLTKAGNHYSGGHDITLGSVRFGNVINSSQSVIPLFHQQIRNGGPITLTDDRMTRFFLTYDELGQLLLQAMDKVRGGEIFLHKMAAVRIADLAEAMRTVLAPEYGYAPDHIEIEMVGSRPGETLHEEIMTSREAKRAYESESTYLVCPESTEYYSYAGVPDTYHETDRIVRSSEDAPKLTKEEIVDLLADAGALGGIK